jgi:hypothetical protein
MRPNLVNNHKIHVHSKAGGEGTVVFNSAIALLQGLFPPNSTNKIVLANETMVVAPLGGYQYIPGQFCGLLGAAYLITWKHKSKLSNLAMTARWKAGRTVPLVT